MPDATRPADQDDIRTRLMRRNSEAVQLMALFALFAGALAIASSGIFVRLSQTGPTATAFWRGALALPLLAVWAWLERRGASVSAAANVSPDNPAASPAEDERGVWRRNAGFFWGGVFFAGDLALWHWSLLLTSVAAATLEANLAPVFVTLIAWFLWRERPQLRFLLALALALAGLGLIVSPKLGGSGRALIGDVLGVGTACFYAGYIVVVARLRAVHGAGTVMFRTSVVFTALLLPLALTQEFLPHSLEGWGLLLGLAWIGHVIGQGLIAYALAHLPATFGSVGLYVQPVAAAVYAWALLGEQLTGPQIVGGAIVLGAIALARSARKR